MKNKHLRLVFIGTLGVTLLLLGFQNCADTRLARNSTPSLLATTTTLTSDVHEPDKRSFDPTKEYLYGDNNKNDWIDEAFEIGLQNDPVAKGERFKCQPGSFPWTKHPKSGTSINTADGRSGYFCYAVSCTPDGFYSDLGYACCDSNNIIDTDKQCCQSPKEVLGAGQYGICITTKYLRDETQATTPMTPSWYPIPRPIDQPAEIDPNQFIPSLRYSSPLKFRGRVVDSSIHTDSRWRQRTLRASTIRPQQGAGKILLGLHGTVAKYDLNELFMIKLGSALQGSSLNQKYPDPNKAEKFLPWNSFFLPELAGSGWPVINGMEGTHIIDMPIDADDRGLVYLSHVQADGWGIVSDLPQELRNGTFMKSHVQVHSDSNPYPVINDSAGQEPLAMVMDMKVMRVGLKTYLWALGLKNEIALYDVTDPRKPRFKWKKVAANRFSGYSLPEFIYTKEGPVIGYINEGAMAFEFYNFNTMPLAPPIFTLALKYTKSHCSNIVSNLSQFYLLQGPTYLGTNTSGGEPLILQSLKIENGKAVPGIPKDLPSFCPAKNAQNGPRYDNGLITVVGYPGGLTNFAMPLIIDVLTPDGEPREVELPGYFENFYYERPTLNADFLRDLYTTSSYYLSTYTLPRDFRVVPYDGKYYYFIFNYGIGDVFETERQITKNNLKMNKLST